MQTQRRSSTSRRHAITAKTPVALSGCPVKGVRQGPGDRHCANTLDDQCIGCKYCTMMCPYEVPQYSKRLGIVRKCDMCHQRLSVGEAPACVQSCPERSHQNQDRCPIRSRAQFDLQDDGLVPIGSRSRQITSSDHSNTSASRFDGLVGAVRPQDEQGVDDSGRKPLAVGTDAGRDTNFRGRIGRQNQSPVGHAVAVRFQRNPPALIPDPQRPCSAFVIGNVGLGHCTTTPRPATSRCWRVFLGLKTSWLSREAVVLGKYMGASCLLELRLHVALPVVWDWIPESDAELGFRPNGFPRWAGRALVRCVNSNRRSSVLYCSAMIYIATRSVSFGVHERTLPRFFGTAATCGPVGPLVAAAVFAFSEGFPV